MIQFLYRFLTEGLEYILENKVLSFLYNLIAGLFVLGVFYCLYRQWYLAAGLLIFLILVLIFAFLFAYRFINDQVIKQFVVLNEQLGLKIRIPKQKWNNTKWVYPTLKGPYLNRYLSILSFEKSGTAKVVVTLDVVHYGKTFKLKPETFKSAMRKLKLFKLIEFLMKIFFIRKSKWVRNMQDEVDVITGDNEFDARFLVDSNDPFFITRLLDDKIRGILKKDVFKRVGEFSLNQGQLRYQEELVLNTDEERKRFENVVLVLHMMAKRMELMRIGRA